MTDVVAALIWQGNRFLICQRPKEKARGLLWEFVGGKVEPGESREDALIRECREELGVTVAVGPLYMEVTHEYPDLTVRLFLYHARIAGGKLFPYEHAATAFILPEETGKYDFCPADETILERIRTEFGRGEVTMETKEFYISHDGLKLHAKLDLPEEKKEKYPLLILEHGYTGHMEERHITGIAGAVTEAGFACLRIELYGHGGSDGSFRDHDIGKWVEEMLTVIDYAADLPFAGKLFLAGHSQGGLTAMIAGAMKRDRLSGLIPLAPAIVIWDKARTGGLFGASYDPDHVPDEVDMGGGRVLSGNYFRVAQFLPVEEAIRAFKGPVLIVHADTDEAVPFVYAQEAAAKYADCELVVLPGDTHCYDRRLPEAESAVVRFLKAHS